MICVDRGRGTTTMHIVASFTINLLHIVGDADWEEQHQQYEYYSSDDSDWEEHDQDSFH